MSRILIGNIKGPQGAQGIQGPQGPVGATGPQGPMPDLINNALATEAGVAALDARMGKTLQDQITDLNSDFIYATNTDDLISKVSELASNRTYTLFASGSLINELIGENLSGKGTIAKRSDDMYDLMLQLGDSTKAIMGKFAVSTKTLTYNVFALKADLDNRLQYKSYNTVFNQIAIQTKDDGSHAIHFYKDGVWICQVNAT